MQVTRDAGAHWIDRTEAVAAAGGPADAWVTRVYPSRFQPGTAYVTKSRRREDDFHVYVFRTENYGASWVNLSTGLPEGGANVIVEDTVKPNLLFLGTDSGIYVSFDAGSHWQRMKANVPSAPVQDLLVHPREGDLVVGTFGRGVWVTNIGPLREFTSALLSEDVHLFATRPFAERREVAWGNYRLYGDRYPVTPNEPNGMSFLFYLRDSVSQGGTLTISDRDGKVVRKLNLTGKAGMNSLTWLLDDGSNAPVPAGEYTVNVNIAGKNAVGKARLISRAPEDFPRPRRFLRAGSSADLP